MVFFIINITEAGWKDIILWVRKNRSHAFNLSFYKDICWSHIISQFCITALSASQNDETDFKIINWAYEKRAYILGIYLR